MTKKKSLLSYIGLTKQAGILKEVTFNDKISKVHLSGFIGSSFATIASGLLIEDNNPHLFVLRDKKEASHFLNDLNNLIDSHDQEWKILGIEPEWYWNHRVENTLRLYKAYLIIFLD